MPKLKIFQDAIQTQLEKSYKDDPAMLESVKEHGEGYVHFIKKELKRKGYDVEIVKTGEGSEGEYDDSELTQEEKLKAGGDFVSLPLFVEWFEQPAYG